MSTRSLWLAVFMCCSQFAWAHQNEASPNAEMINPQAAQQQSLHTPLTFDRLVALALTLTNTKSWETAEGKQLTDPTNPNASSLLALRKLLAGDTTAAVSFFTDPARPLAYPEVAKAIKSLRDGGYPLAANALHALNPDLSDARVIAWLQIPADKRKPIDDYMLQRYHASSPNRAALAQVGWKLYATPPKDDGLTPDAFFDFALWFGKDTGVNAFGTVVDLVDKGKTDGALKLLTWMSADDPNNLQVQREIAYYLTYALRPAQPEVLAFYRAQLTAAPAPTRRELRLDYLEALQSKQLTPPDDTLAAHQTDQAPLVAGDACLVDAKYEPATTQYQTVLNDPTADLPHRVAAWSGLLDSHPTVALPAAPALLDEIEKMKDTALRSTLVTWCGWQLHRVTDREVPLSAGQYRTVSRSTYRPVRDVKDWQKTLAALMDRLLAIDAVAVLQPHPTNTPSLRYTAALIYALAGDAAKAGGIAKREITYQAPPPRGGWTIFPGTPDKDADKPRAKTSPLPGETEALMKTLLAAMERYNTATNRYSTEKIPTDPPNLDLLGDLCSRVDLSKDQKEVQRLLKEFGEQFVLAIAHIDPPRTGLRAQDPIPPPRAYDTGVTARLRARVRIAFRQEFACRYAPWFINNGLRPALLTASNPRLLHELCTLTIEVIEKYAKLEGAAKAADLAATFNTYLESRKIYDMTPYMQRLREQFPPADTPPAKAP